MAMFLVLLAQRATAYGETTVLAKSEADTRTLIVAGTKGPSVYLSQGQLVFWLNGLKHLNLAGE